MKQRKKWKRLTLAEMEAFNRKGFEEAKREFDKKHGRLFSYQYAFKTLRCTHKRKYSFADQIENALAGLLGCYETGRLPSRFSFGDGVFLSMGILADIFVVTDRFFGAGYELDEEDVAQREAEDYWEPFAVDYELDETAQASRIRGLFRKIVTLGTQLAHKVGSDTYGQWRDLLVYLEDFIPPLTHHLTDEDSKDCYDKLSGFETLHHRLRIDMMVGGKDEFRGNELGKWAAAWVSDYNVKAGFVELCRGKQRSYRIAASSKKAWEILTALFTTDDPEGWTKLPTGWKSQFVRKIGSSGELDRDSDIVKIAALIVPHTPRKGRGGDGLYRFGFARPPKAK